MRYRVLGATGLDVSVIGLGTWQFSGEWGKQFTQSEVDDLIGRAGELGVNLIDTAECYGDHLAESLVGHAIRGNRERWVVATKFGHRFHPERMGQPHWGPGDLRTDHWSPEEVVGQLDDSLSALGTEYVDVYQVHGGSAEAFETSGLWAALQGQVRSGRIRHLGISLDPDEDWKARRAPEAGAKVIQVSYNRLNRVAEENVLPVCEQLGLGVLAREPLANGFLSGKYRAAGTTPSDWRASLDPAEVGARLRAVAAVQANMPDRVEAPARRIASPAIEVRQAARDAPQPRGTLASWTGTALVRRWRSTGVTMTTRVASTAGSCGGCSGTSDRTGAPGCWQWAAS